MKRLETNLLPGDTNKHLQPPSLLRLQCHLLAQESPLPRVP